MTRSLQGHPNATAGRWFRNTAELSGELSVGDVVAAGDVLLAVARAGWEPVTGPLTEVRTCGHGTRPLPGPALPGGLLAVRAVTAAKEARDERP
jgi:hypothetical protein